MPSSLKGLFSRLPVIGLSNKDDPYQGVITDKFSAPREDQLPAASGPPELFPKRKPETMGLNNNEISQPMTKCRNDLPLFVDFIIPFC